MLGQLPRESGISSRSGQPEDAKVRLVVAVADRSSSVGTRKYRQALAEVTCQKEDLAVKWLVRLAHEITQ